MELRKVFLTQSKQYFRHKYKLVSTFSKAHTIREEMLSRIIPSLHKNSQQLGSLNIQYEFAYRKTKPRKIPNLHQRIKRYSRYPDKYKLVTYIRPPNFRDDTLEFPIHIPIRYRHLYRPSKPLVIESIKNIKWHTLSPNEILLAFENMQYLKHSEIIQGLVYLSKVQGQEQHDWNEHPWVSQAFTHVEQNLHQIKTGDIMKMYHLMKRLNSKSEAFWSQIYAKIEENIYELYPSDFEHIFIKYYKTADVQFSSEMKGKLLKLMEGRLREFNNQSVLSIFEIFIEQQRLDAYWLENVFVSLFKAPHRKYTPKQIGQIFRFMMIVEHEENQRLYDSLYTQVLRANYKTVEELEGLREVIEEVREIFTSHRVEPYLEFLQEKKVQLLQRKVQDKRSIHQIVREDLKYFRQRQQLQNQSLSVQNTL